MCFGKVLANEPSIFKKLIMKNNKEQKILRITIDNKLNCKSHIKEICEKASWWNLSLFMALSFGCSVPEHQATNKVHERALRVVLNDHTSDFRTLLQKNNDLSNHHRNIQTLLIEIFKAKNGLGPSIIGSIFKRRNTNYEPRTFQYFDTERKSVVHFGLET